MANSIITWTSTGSFLGTSFGLRISTVPQTIIVITNPNLTTVPAAQQLCLWSYSDQDKCVDKVDLDITNAGSLYMD